MDESTASAVIANPATPRTQLEHISLQRFAEGDVASAGGDPPTTIPPPAMVAAAAGDGGSGGGGWLCFTVEEEVEVEWRTVALRFGVDTAPAPGQRGSISNAVFTAKRISPALVAPLWRNFIPHTYERQR
jgi:hypothetical protein